MAILVTICPAHSPEEPLCVFKVRANNQIIDTVVARLIKTGGSIIPQITSDREALSEALAGSKPILPEDLIKEGLDPNVDAERRELAPLGASSQISLDLFREPPNPVLPALTLKLQHDLAQGRHRDLIAGGDAPPALR